MTKKIITALLLFALLAPLPALAAEMVMIKGGSFRMGSPAAEAWREKDERPHSVTVSDFRISKYEVSQSEYRALMGDRAFTFSGGELPADGISWHDAVRYCNALSAKEGLTPAYRINGEEVSWDRDADGYRLPTEAEWEYACRAGTATPFSSGENVTTDQANYYGSYPYADFPSGEYRGATVSVKSFAANPLGLHNMHGNVWEWCWDRYGEYGADGAKDPSGAQSGRYRVMRGGGWNDFGKHLRSAYRSAAPPNLRMYNFGFRVARSVK
ncbi:MAG: SUMF1/EgtB/PvdO family nonheme iron enzyme [Synergistaceae bacterium]|nr:SUMF1/EgtB/PvdO family nonheme iron enzyme [Synergistaceae bacterium]